MPHLTPREYLALAYEQATKSKDPSTQNGAVIVDVRGSVIGQGFNRFTAGLVESSTKWNARGQKYPRVCHAEIAAIWSAIRNGHAQLLRTSTLYCPWYACEGCAHVILESGIRTVVGHAAHPGVIDAHSTWGPKVALGLEFLAEAGVACSYVRGPVFGPKCSFKVRVNYELFQP